MKVVIQIMREALEKLAKLGNGNEYGNSDGNIIAQDALKKIDSISEPLPEGLTQEVIDEAADYLRTVAEQAKLVTQFAGIDLKYFDKETLINLLVFVEVDRAFREGREVKEKSFADSLAIVGRIPKSI